MLQHPPDRPPHHHPHPRAFRDVNSPFTEALSEYRCPETIDHLMALIQTHQPGLAPILNNIIGEKINDPHVAVMLLQIDEGIERLRALRELILLIAHKKAAVIFPLPPHISDRLMVAVDRDVTFTSDHHLPPHLAWQGSQHIEHLMPHDIAQRLNGLEALALEGVHDNGNLSVRRNVARLLQIIHNPRLRLFVHQLPHVPHHVELAMLDGEYEVIYI